MTLDEAIQSLAKLREFMPGDAPLRVGNLIHNWEIAEFRANKAFTGELKIEQPRPAVLVDVGKK